MGGLEESTGEGAAKVGGNASLTEASNDMCNRQFSFNLLIVFTLLYQLYCINSIVLILYMLAQFDL